MMTKWQRIHAQSPHRASPTELYRVMEILSDHTTWKEFGEERFAIVLNVHKAALTKRIQIPMGFANLVQNLNNDPSLFKRPSTFRPKID